MLSLLVFLFILGLLIVVHEFGHFIIAKKCGIRVEKFALGFGRALFKKTKDGTEYSICAIPLGGYVKLAGDNQEEFQGKKDEYLSKPVSNRAAVVFFGPLLNYCLAFLCFWFIFIIGYPTLTTKVGKLIDGYGAKEAGIMEQDKIIAIDNKEVKYWEDMQEKIQKKKTKDIISLTVEREGKVLNFEVKIKEKEFTDLLGSKANVGLIGIAPSDDIVSVKHGVFQSLSLAAKRTLDLTVITYKALWRMMLGKVSFKDSVTGPLGIFYITSKAAHLGFIAVLHLLAVLSLSLCIFNLLPFPVLDGGHLVLLLIEKIRGKMLSIKADRILTQTGMSFIILLALFVTVNDIIKYKDSFFKKSTCQQIEEKQK